MFDYTIKPSRSAEGCWRLDIHVQSRAQRDYVLTMLRSVGHPCSAGGTRLVRAFFSDYFDAVGCTTNLKDLFSHDKLPLFDQMQTLTKTKKVGSKGRKKP